MSLFLNTLLENTPKVSRKILPALRRLGIKTARDLLFHFPTRYEDFSNLKKIREVKPNEIVTIRGQIKKVTTRRTAKKRMFLTEVLVGDDTGTIKALWFNQPHLARNLKLGSAVNLSGKIVLGANGIYLQSPAHEKIINPTGIHTGCLVAIYPETRGITSRWLRYLINLFLDLRKELTDPLPPETRRKYQLPEIKDAVYSIHFPKSFGEAERARKRFNFEELLLIQLRVLKERLRLKEHQAPVIQLNLPLMKEFVGSLPFQLTNAQRRSIWEIIQDISRARPMNRLLEGDVGSGKTVVAAAASLLAVKAGYRVAFMAPTEILAKQHFETLGKVLAPFRVKLGLIMGSEKRVEKDTEVAVGTHALIQNKVKFENLGLVIVDEQHRFGVEQRAALISRESAIMLPHFLSMSATPIPRTLALTIYGDLDLSILDEMPKFRKEVITKIVEPSKRGEAYQFIGDEVKKGKQVFVICPRIELATSHERRVAGATQQKLLLADTKAVKEEHRKLKEEIFKDLRVGMLHGKMKAREKVAVMSKFKNREIDILVSTSVVEVGLDISNATVMMIEGAERFGLAQLHQFRGRVGRGADQSYCFLFPDEDGMVTRRLRAVVEAKNGFELAEKDLEIRGPGDIFGTRQWGVTSEVIASLSDVKLVRAVRNEAVEILKKDPQLKIYPVLKKRLEEREKMIHPE